jgi:hypothetical protein
MATPTTLPAAFVSGDVLTAAQQNDLRGAFRVLQQVENSYSTQTGYATGTYATTNLTATLTPQSTTNKILINVAIPISTDTAGGQLGIRYVYTIGGSTTVIQTFTYALYNSAGGSYANFSGPVAFTPASTSAVTITIQAARTGGGGTVYTNVGNSASSIVIQEISA